VLPEQQVTWSLALSLVCGPDHLVYGAVAVSFTSCDMIAEFLTSVCSDLTGIELACMRCLSLRAILSAGAQAL
jgi:hypothetical protein